MKKFCFLTLQRRAFYYNNSKLFTPISFNSYSTHIEKSLSGSQFSNIGINSPILLKNIEEVKWEKPTNVQKEAIKVVLNGRDVCILLKFLYLIIDSFFFFYC